jgi:hypothetical protein
VNYRGDASPVSPRASQPIFTGSIAASQPPTVFSTYYAMTATRKSPRFCVEYYGFSRTGQDQILVQESLKEKMRMTKCLAL